MSVAQMAAFTFPMPLCTMMTSLLPIVPVVYALPRRTVSFTSPSSDLTCANSLSIAMTMPILILCVVLTAQR